MDHRLAQILGAGVAARVLQIDVVAGAVVLDHMRIVDRKVGVALVDVRDARGAAQRVDGGAGVGCRVGRRQVVDPGLAEQPTGDARYFAKAGNTLIFSPSVANATALQGRYYHSLPALSATTLAANALFAENEDLFVYAALTE